MITTITPNIVKFIDFSGSRSIKITVQSPSDTKAVYALIDNSWRALTYLNGYWTYTINLPYIANIGTYIIQLKSIDYAGNEATAPVSYTVYDNTGLGMGNGGSGGGSGESGGSGGSDDGNGGSGESGGGSGGSPGGSGGSSGGSSANLMNILFFFIILLFVLIAIAGIFAAVLIFSIEIALILAALTSTAGLISIFTDLGEILNFIFNLLFGGALGGVIEGLFVTLAIIGIFSLFLGPTTALILLISGLFVFIAITVILLSYFYFKR